MPRTSAVIALLLLTACATVGGRTPVQSSPSSAEFTPGPDGGVGRERVRNSTLERVTLEDGTPVLLAIDHTRWIDPADEDGGGRVTVTALAWDGAAFTRLLWALEEPAEDWRASDYLRLTEYGCCDLDATHTFRDLRTGSEVAWFTEEPLSAYDAAGKPVLIAYESPQSTRVPEGFDGAGVQGMLRIVRGAAVTDSVVVTGSGEDEAGYMIGRGVFCGADGAVRMRPPDAVSDDQPFHVCYQFESGAWAVLPVRGGRFVLEDARFPAGVSARRGGW